MVHRKTVAMINADDPQQRSSPKSWRPIYPPSLWRDNMDNIVGVIHARLLLREHAGGAAELNIPALATDPWLCQTTRLLDQLHFFEADTSISLWLLMNMAANGL